MEERLRIRNRTHPPMNTLKGGYTKILIKVKNIWASELASLLPKLLVQSREKRRLVGISQLALFVWGGSTNSWW